MQKLTPQGEALVAEVSQRYNLSHDAVIHMLGAVNNGGGQMAQFNCPELGGGGQWMRGGMIMVGDMFNHGLKSTVDGLCNDLANGLANIQVYPVIPAGTVGSNQWWPQNLGSPFSSGGQNNIRYAVFAGRLAVDLNGSVTIHDTLDHQVGGVSQQQGGNTSLTFSSQYGTLSVSSLPIVSGAGLPSEPDNNFTNPAASEAAPPLYEEEIAEPVSIPEPTFTAPPESSHQEKTASADDIIQLIGKLKQLNETGVLTNDEFGEKKIELLARL